MALRTLLRQLRSKAPSLAHPIPGDCSEGVGQFRSSESKLTQWALMCNSYSSSLVQTCNASNLRLQRGYSSETFLEDKDNGCTLLDSPSHSILEAKNSPNETFLEDSDNGCTGLDSPSQGIVEAKNSPNEPTADGIKSVNLGPKISERHNLAMIFTCTVCQTRSAKTMSRETYEKGVVIVRCGGCKNLHLIADHLGWFGEPGSVEDFLKHKGVEVRKGSEGSYEFSVEDLAGWSPPGKD